MLPAERLFPISGLAIALAFSTGCGPADPAADLAELGSSASAIVGGTEDATAMYPQVCTFVADVGELTISGCTGTLVSPTALVTAAHCAQAFTLFGPTENLGASCAVEVDASSPRVPGHFVVNPAYEGSLATVGDDPNDVAVFVLDEPLHARLGRVPNGPIGAGARAPITIVGYGTTEFGAKTLPEYFFEPKVRRVGQAALGDVTSDYLYVSPDPSIGCFLDSGSAAFLASSRVILGTLQVSDCESFSQYVRLQKPSVDGFLAPYLPGNG